MTFFIPMYDLILLIVAIVVLVLGTTWQIYRYRRWSQKGGSYGDWWRANHWGFFTRQYGNPWLNEPNPTRLKHPRDPKFAPRPGPAAMQNGNWYRMDPAPEGEWADGRVGGYAQGRDVERGSVPGKDGERRYEGGYGR